MAWISLAHSAVQHPDAAACEPHRVAPALDCRAKEAGVNMQHSAVGNRAFTYARPHRASCVRGTARRARR